MRHGFMALAIALALAGAGLLGPSGASAFTLVIAPAAPPAVIVESASPAPGPEFAWIAGHWDWRGHWAWVHGYWARRPHPEAVWVTGNWVVRDGRWVWFDGHWR